PSPSKHTTRETSASVPALSNHITPAVPPPLSLPSPPFPLPAGRRSEPRPHFSFPEARPTCAAPPPYPVCPLPHLLSSARTRPAVPTKTKIRRWTCALLTSAPLRAGASPPPVAPCIFPAPSAHAPAPGRASFLNLFPRARA